MESENVKSEGNIVAGVIGAILGGFVGSIPWVLMYVYGNMILSLLAILIAACSFYGYKLFKGPINKSLPIIIAVVSIVCVVVSTLIFIPALMLVQEGALVNAYNFKILYAYQPFVDAIIKDLTISIIFTILGISGIVSSLKKQINNKETVKIEFNNSRNVLIKQSMNEQINITRDAFAKFNAFDKTNTVTKEDVIKEMNIENAEAIFSSMKVSQIIKKYKGKYYFRESYAKSVFRRFISLFGKIMLWIIVIMFIFIVFLMSL